jgi:hypothetical protein
MKTTIVAALLLGAMFTTGTAVAYADEVEVINHQYHTQEACMADGPNVRLAEHDAEYPYFACKLDPNDGMWHLFNSTTAY